MGAIMIYGSYLPKDVSIAKTVYLIAGTDTAVAYWPVSPFFRLFSPPAGTCGRSRSYLSNLAGCFRQHDRRLLFGILFL